MAVTAALVYAGHDRLRYLVTADGSGAATLTTTGAATPDLLTDSLVGPIKAAAKAFTDGFGLLAAGALTQAKARAIWMSNDPTFIATTNGMPISLVCALSERDATTDIQAIVDANVDGSGHPTIVITVLAAGTAYLDVLAPNTIGA